MKMLDEVFPDWREMELGTWSKNGMVFNSDGVRIEIGLYREPKESEELAGTYTLQVFYNDDVMLCVTINPEENLYKK